MGLISASACTCLLLAAGGSLAFPCLHQSAMTQATRDSNQIIRVAEFGGSGRKTAEEYAKIHGQTTKQIEDRFASSGQMKCGAMSSGAELVQTNDTVVVSMHAIYKDRTCELQVPLDQCSIRFKKDGTNQFFKPNQIIASGAPCPHPGKAQDGEDWLLLKLDKEAGGFKPYKPRDPNTMSSSKVVAVGQSVDFYQMSGNKKYYPMHYSDCDTKDTKYRGMLGTTCGGSGATSGSGLFDDNKQDPHIIGVYLGSSETKEIQESELAQHRVENRPYNADNWTSTYVPVNGKLARALANLSAPTITPLDRKSSKPTDSGSSETDL